MCDCEKELRFDEVEDDSTEDVADKATEETTEDSSDDLSSDDEVVGDVSEEDSSF